MSYEGKPVIVQDKTTESQLLEELVKVLGAERFDLWFGTETSVLLTEQSLTLGVRNRFSVDWIRKNFISYVNQACTNILGYVPTISIIVDKEAFAPAKIVSSIPSNQQQVLPSIPPSTSPLFSLEVVPSNSAKSPIQNPFASVNTVRTTGRSFASLDQFVEGLSNRLALRAAELAVNHPGKFNPIYIHGPSSTGKTHLLEGIWSAVRQKRGRKPPLYMTSEQFISSFLESIRPGSPRSGVQEFRNKFKGISVLLIDDLHYFSPRADATQAELRNIIDTLKAQGIQLVFTGDRAPSALTSLRKEIVSRLEDGIVCCIEQPERETSLRICKNIVISRKLPISQDVCRMVSSRFGLHARQLSGALNLLHAFHLSSGQAITLEVAEQTLADLAQNQRRSVRLEDIDKAVCEMFQLNDDTLQSKSRVKHIATPRMLAMWLARKHTRSALSEIGRYFGDRSHSTVLTARKNVERWIEENKPIAPGDASSMPIAELIRKIERTLLISE